MKRNLFLTSLLFLLASTAFATTHHVNINVQGGSNDGTSWPNAFTSLGDAIAAATYGDTIWVAQGTYLPTLTANRHFYFNLKNGVMMYGGFVGNETQLVQRDWATNATILSGDIGVPGDSTDNAYTVVNCGFVDSTTVLDGFTVTGGNADSQVQNEPPTGRTKSGGGVYLVNGNNTADSRPNFVHCTFSGNHAVNNGGGAFVRSGSAGRAAPVFLHCVFLDNTASKGGGLYIEGNGLMYDGVVDSCRFIGNYGIHGGGLAYVNSNGTMWLQVRYSDFHGNACDVGGGGLYVENADQMDSFNILKCSFTENYLIGAGGGAAVLIYSSVDIPVIVFDSCSFIANRTEGSGGGGTIEAGYIDLVLRSCAFEKNSLASVACIILGSVNLKAYNCRFAENSSQSVTGIINLASSSNLYAGNCTFVNNSYIGNGALIWNPSLSSPDSIVVHNSLFYGNTLSNNGRLFRIKTTIASHTLVDVPDCTSISERPVDCGPGMLYLADPLFADTSAGDLRLLPCSPARNAGSNAIVDSLGLLYDIVGLPRIRGGVVDMGAHESPAFQATAATVLSQPCGDDDGGMVSLLLENGCPPFFLDWGGGTAISDTASAIISLPLGTHAVTVTDGRMESDTIAVTVTAAPLPTATVTATPVICATSMGGTATATATDGTAPFVYAWANGDATATADGLAAGTHVFTVTDANGCTVVDSVTVETSGGLQVGVSISPVSCHPANGAGADGTATAQPIGGVGPFSWLWSSGDATPGIDSLAGGSYSATVTDVLGCTGDVSFTMNAPTEVLASIKVMQPLCHGNLATTTATATGGTPGYTFLWSSGAATATTMLPEGHHTVTVTDMVGCVDNVSVDVVAPPLLVANAEAEPPVLCHGASNGTLNVQPTGGTSPYSWGGPTDGLPAGSYTITVTDSNGCTAAASATVAEHPAIMATGTVANASSPTAQDGGVALADVTGGTGSGYQYLWSNGDTAQSLTGVGTGSYSVTVTDGQGCTGVFGFFVDFISSGAGEAGKGLFGVAIMPNPSGGAGARLVVGAVPVGTVAVRVFDGQGRLVFTGMLSAATMALPEGYAAGTYLVLLDADGRRTSLKWVVGE